MRMSAVVAALARRQLELLPPRAEAWNVRYRQLAEGLRRVAGIQVPDRDSGEH
ncbi:MAG: hypothetical protein DHS20C19_26460 [Acidimicrobiales bacterium]|nr:MAG: hypothetical protein DHS20C19_26460 [Acidimicrobiales bacterium]